MTTKYQVVHFYSWRHLKGRIWIECRCGKRSPTYDEFQIGKLIVWANKHTKQYS